MVWWQKLLDFIFPRFCFGCSRYGEYVCAFCVNRVRRYQKFTCLYCQKQCWQGKVHPRCQRPWGLDGVLIGLEYETLVERLIVQTKFQGAFDCLPVVFELWYSLSDWEPIMEAISTGGWWVCPIPLHRYRLAQRGFNQSALLAKLLANSLGLPLGLWLDRQRSTPPQSKLPSSKRSQNIAGAFSLKTKAQYLPKKIILVDDVLTTGSTVKEAAKVLKRNGVDQVWALAASG